jgi:glyoxalase family protein
VGTGQAAAVALAVAPDGLDAMRERLGAAGIAARPGERFGEPLLALTDPDGLPVEVIGTKSMPAGGLHSVTLWVDEPGPVAHLLETVLGHVPAGEADGPEGARLRLAVPGASPGRFVDLLRRHGAEPGRPGPGTIHHIAFRAADAGAQAAMAAAAAALGLAVSAVRDRTYFRSIYFRAPGGVLFEIATDGPGFAVDEPAGALGRGLCLPPALEGRRAAIAAGLPPLRRGA